MSWDRVTKVTRCSQLSFPLSNSTSLTQVRRWEGGQTAPSIDNAVLLARFYNVSLDRLCGLQDRPDIDLEGLDEKQIEALKAVVEGFK